MASLCAQARKQSACSRCSRIAAGCFRPTMRTFSPALRTQSAAAIERASLAADIAQARLQTETERLRSNLLSTISHDLRTPLVAILGATTTLRDYWDKFDDAERRDLFVTIEDEVRPPQSFCAEFARHDAAGFRRIEVKRQPTEIQDLVGAACDAFA